jgi:hypothetical protein
MGTEHYTIGRGKVLLKVDGAGGYRDLGNAPEFGLTVATEKKPHFSSRSGIKTKDLEIVTEQTATGKFTLDELVKENLALFSMATTPASADQTSSSATDDSLVAALDLWVPVGKKSISAVVITTDPAGTTYTLGTDYELDLVNGLVKCLSTGTISAAEDLLISFDYAAVTMNTIDGATATTVKGKVLFLGDPPAGAIVDIEGYVSIIPEGDFNPIGDDWNELGFNMEFLTHTDFTGLYKITDRGTV